MNNFKLDGFTSEQTFLYIFIMMIFSVVVWLIPVLIIAKKYPKNEKNALIFELFFWCAFTFMSVAQIQEMFGVNYAVNTYGEGAMTMFYAFLWPITFASSVGGLLLSKQGNSSRIFAIMRLVLSFFILIFSIFSAIF